MMRHKTMSKKAKPIIFVALVLGVLASAVLYLRTVNMPVLQPSGWVGDRERNLIIFAGLLSLVVVIPVFAMLFGFAWKYREGNRKKAKYAPNLSGSKLAEAIWWVIPTALITILSVVTWTSSHELDPYKPLASNTRPLTVQVVSLQWKWLFIYPDQHIATVNYLQIPSKTPVNFELTSTNAMNSFWVPGLGGQVYTMTGMSTKLHLMADKNKTYYGSSANISGRGFSGMHFQVKATSQQDFDSWAQTARKHGAPLTMDAYALLSKPSENVPPRHYRLAVDNLYATIINKYMPMSSDSTMDGMDNGGMH